MVKKSLGQHFLIDKNILSKVIDAAGLTKKDVVLEIGAGNGVLTKELAKKAKKVIAVEIDRKLVSILKETLKRVENVEIIHGDILNFKAKITNVKFRFKVVSNIPYKITSPLLEKILFAENKPSLIVLMVQKEVARKICCRPPRMNRLGLLVQFFGKPEIVSYVSKNCFRPKPEVESAILRIAVNQELRSKNQKNLFKIIKRGFSQKRKQLKNIFDKEILKNVGIMPEIRAEILSLEDWKKIDEAHRHYYQKN